MADGFNVPLAPEQIAQLKAAAERYGLSPADYAAALIEAGLSGAPPRIIDPDPAIDHAIAEDARRNGDLMPWPEVRDRLLARHGR